MKIGNIHWVELPNVGGREQSASRDSTRVVQAGRFLAFERGAQL